MGLANTLDPHDEPAFLPDDMRAIKRLAALPAHCQKNALAIFHDSERTLLDCVEEVAALRAPHLKAI